MKKQLSDEEKRRLAELKFPYPKYCCAHKRMKINWKRENWIKENF